VYNFFILKRKKIREGEKRERKMHDIRASGDGENGACETL
jgi:hypothetical protein